MTADFYRRFSEASDGQYIGFQHLFFFFSFSFSFFFFFFSNRLVKMFHNFGSTDPILIRLSSMSSPCWALSLFNIHESFWLFWRLMWVVLTQFFISQVLLIRFCSDQVLWVLLVVLFHFTPVISNFDSCEFRRLTWVVLTQFSISQVLLVRFWSDQVLLYFPGFTGLRATV